MISDMLSKHVGAMKSVLKKLFKINGIQLVYLLVVWYLVYHLHVYEYCKVRLPHHDLLNYRMGLLKADIFISLWFGIDWNFVSYYLFLTNIVSNKKLLTLRIDSAASSESQGNLPCFMYFPRPALEAARSTSTPCFLFTCGRNKLYLSYTLLMVGWTPKEITQHQAFISAILNVY